jgi:hypothetical protein
MAQAARPSCTTEEEQMKLLCRSLQEWSLALIATSLTTGCHCETDFVAPVCCIQGPTFEGQANRLTPDGRLNQQECSNLCHNLVGRSYEFVECRNVRVAYYVGPGGAHLPEWTGGLGGSVDQDGSEIVPTGTPYYELDCVGIDHNTCNDTYTPQLSYD